jgi:hypothetical protein
VAASDSLRPDVLVGASSPGMPSSSWACCSCSGGGCSCSAFEVDTGSGSTPDTPDMLLLLLLQGSALAASSARSVGGVLLVVLSSWPGNTAKVWSVTIKTILDAQLRTGGTGATPRTEYVVRKSSYGCCAQTKAL